MSGSDENGITVNDPRLTIDEWLNCCDPRLIIDGWLNCCDHCGCPADDRTGHDDSCEYGCNDSEMEAWA